MQAQRRSARILPPWRPVCKSWGAQEQKYSAELDKVLAEYAELKAQAAGLDPTELFEARQAVRPVQEKSAEQQLEDAM